MDYKLAEELKDAGFPQKGKGENRAKSPGCKHFATKQWVKKPNFCGCFVYCPTLEELIDWCGDGFMGLHKYYEKNPVYENWRWKAEWYEGQGENQVIEIGKTPKEAVAKLWLELNKKRQK